MVITTLIPAHNEADALPATVASLRAQTVPPNRIVVVSDNSTDDTVGTATRLGVEVVETVGNTHRKAGALNQALADLAETTPAVDDLVLVMDADTELVPTWIETALGELAEPAVGGVGAVFSGATPRTYLETCQYLEWTRYAEQIDRTGKTFVLSGTAALVRWVAFAGVAAATGHYYNPRTITEDMRLTLDLKAAGWELRSPAALQATTEMMPTVRMLWLQRRRWYLGALQNVSEIGFSRVTAPYVGQQVMLALSVVLLWGLVCLTATALVLYGPTTPSAFWVSIGVIFAAERVVTVWDRDIRYRVFAAAVFPELIYAFILQTAYVAAVWQKVTGSAGTWAHLPPTEGTELCMDQIRPKQLH